MPAERVSFTLAELVALVDVATIALQVGAGEDLDVDALESAALKLRRARRKLTPAPAPFPSQPIPRPKSVRRLRSKYAGRQDDEGAGA